MGRLVLVVSAFPKLSEIFIARKFAGLRDSGWDVHVVCSASEREEWSRLPAELRRPELKRRVHRVWPHRPRWLAAALMIPAVAGCFLRNPAGTWRYVARGRRRLGASLLKSLYLDAPIVALSPDIVHFEFGSLAAGRTHLGELLGCRVVVSFRGYDLNFTGSEDPAHYGPVWEAADAIHLLGEDLWRRAQERGCPPSRLHALIPPAVDVAGFPVRDPRGGVLGTAERPLRILSIGRLTWKKGYEYGLAAVAEAAARGLKCEYRIVGDGEDRGLIAFVRHQLGLDGVVELLGALPNEDVRRELGWADLVLHSAVSEGFCNAVVEAQAAGLPVVCSDAGGLPENVADGQTGFVVARREPREAADRLETLARDSETRERFGRAGRRRAAALFDLAAQIAAFERLYAAAAQGRHGAEPAAPAVSLAEIGRPLSHGSLHER